MTAVVETPRMARSGVLLTVVFVATVMISLNATMLNVALPRVVDDLDATAVQGNWMLLSYMLVNGSVLVLAGQLSDSSNLRTIFVGGLAVFTCTSLALALAAEPTMFIIVRGVQGVGAAMLLSTAAAMIALVFPGSLLKGAMGIYLAGFAIAQVAGPTIGGLITTFAGWRWMFLINIPLGIAAITVGWGLLKDLPDRPRRHGRRFDPWGNALIFVGLGALLYALSREQRSGWGDGVVLGCLGLAVFVVALFVVVERSVPNPAIDVALLRDRIFAMANFAGMVLIIPRMVTATLLSLYFQGFEGDDPLAAALKITPLALSVTAGSLMAGRIARTHDDGRTTLGYSIVTSVGVAILLTSMHLDGYLPGLLLGMVVCGFSTGVFSAINSSTIMQTVPTSRAGSINGIRTMFQTAGLSIGTALLLSLAVGGLTPEQSQAFFSGNPEALSPVSVGTLSVGFQIAFAAMLGLVLAATAAGVVLVRDRRP